MTADALAAAGHHAADGGAAATAWPVAVLVAALLTAPYAAGVARYRATMPRAWSPWRTASWGAGALLVGVAVSPVLGVVPDPAVRHMVQHLLLGMLAPLGLVLAAPVTLLLGAASARGRRAVAAVLRLGVVRVLTHPVTSALLHVGGLVVLYLTPLYARAADDPVVHALVLLHFLLAGCLFAWAVAGPDPAPHRPGLATRLGVLVVAAGVHGALATYLYAHADRLPPGGGHTVAQVEAAAQWMYYGGDVAEVLLAVALFAGWWRSRRRADARGSAPSAGRVPAVSPAGAAR
ncbi:cytochrome c oxidase assembly protein [Cellulomonas shaoxiangyii]|uniref:Cytochrome c oxidase assembly protein n=1 Tax=Cellulomonas shaoxiangyii TaxID=2566013 RepID=A0A4P7SL26_9CELL|nr:cytochrome c oxidase assembly protein [Cellulomonas shaoxiangyii]QCB94920.1 cytochrome c oxidase assembly protein [Cellulomonas shaoxiangyii]TGY77384.1 cytochrome c oxidase assembly protein [Cellulomonas shaoxiangyii]